MRITSSTRTACACVPGSCAIPTSTSCFRVAAGGAVCNARLGRSLGSPIPVITSVSSSVFSHPVSMSGCVYVCNNTRGGLTPTNIAFMVIGGSTLNGISQCVPSVLGCRARISGNSVFGAPPMIPVCTTLRALH